MLTLSDSKKSVTLEESGDSSENQESAGTSSSLTESAPESSTVHNDRLNVHILNSNSNDKFEGPDNKVTRKSSLKSRVSGLLISGIRNLSRDKTGQFEDESQPSSAETAWCSSEHPCGKVGGGTSPSC